MPTRNPLLGGPRGGLEHRGGPRGGPEYRERPEHTETYPQPIRDRRYPDTPAPGEGGRGGAAAAGGGRGRGRGRGGGAAAAGGGRGRGAGRGGAADRRASPTGDDTAVVQKAKDAHGNDIPEWIPKESAEWITKGDIDGLAEQSFSGGLVDWEPHDERDFIVRFAEAYNAEMRYDGSIKTRLLELVSAVKDTEDDDGEESDDDGEDGGEGRTSRTEISYRSIYALFHYTKEAEIGFGNRSSNESAVRGVIAYFRLKRENRYAGRTKLPQTKRSLIDCKIVCQSIGMVINSYARGVDGTGLGFGGTSIRFWVDMRGKIRASTYRQIVIDRTPIFGSSGNLIVMANLIYRDSKIPEKFGDLVRRGTEPTSDETQKLEPISDETQKLEPIDAYRERIQELERKTVICLVETGEFDQLKRAVAEDARFLVEGEGEWTILNEGAPGDAGSIEHKIGSAGYTLRKHRHAWDIDGIKINEIGLARIDNIGAQVDDPNAALTGEMPEVTRAIESAMVNDLAPFFAITPGDDYISCKMTPSVTIMQSMAGLINLESSRSHTEKLLSNYFSKVFRKAGITKIYPWMSRYEAVGKAQSDAAQEQSGAVQAQEKSPPPDEFKLSSESDRKDEVLFEWIDSWRDPVAPSEEFIVYCYNRCDALVNAGAGGDEVAWRNLLNDVLSVLLHSVEPRPIVGKDLIYTSRSFSRDHPYDLSGLRKFDHIVKDEQGAIVTDEKGNTRFKVTAMGHNKTLHSVLARCYIWNHFGYMVLSGRFVSALESLSFLVNERAARVVVEECLQANVDRDAVNWVPSTHPNVPEGLLKDSLTFHIGRDKDGKDVAVIKTQGSFSMLHYSIFTKSMTKIMQTKREDGPVAAIPGVVSRLSHDDLWDLYILIKKTDKLHEEEEAKSASLTPNISQPMRIAVVEDVPERQPEPEPPRVPERQPEPEPPRVPGRTTEAPPVPERTILRIVAPWVPGNMPVGFVERQDDARRYNVSRPGGYGGLMMLNEHGQYALSFSNEMHVAFIGRIEARRYVRPAWLRSGLYEMPLTIRPPTPSYDYPEYYLEHLRMTGPILPLTDFLTVFYPGYTWGRGFVGTYDDSRLLMSLDGRTLTLSFYTESMLYNMMRGIAHNFGVRVPRLDGRYDSPRSIRDIPLYLPAVHDRYVRPLPMIVADPGAIIPAGAVRVNVDERYARNFVISLGNYASVDMEPYLRNLPAIEAMIRRN